MYQIIPTFTLEEYLALDAASEHKWEYEDGYVYCLAGSTNDHATIVQNLGFALRQAIGNRPCRIMSESPKVLVSATKHYYPDLVVSCSPAEDGKDMVVRYPLLVAEVLSPSTEQHDKGTKLFAYQQVMSIEVVLLIATDEPCVTVYQRASEHRNQWISQQYRPDAAETSFSILGQSLALADLYRYTSLAFEATAKPDQ
jgi:Uma2 family endonuclease